MVVINHRNLPIASIGLDALHTAPISSSSLGRSFPNKFFFYSISSLKLQAKKTIPSYSKPSPSP